MKNFCNENDIGYASSVWDIKSAHEIVSLKPSMIKIPSATNLNFPIHNYLCENYMGDIHLSTGMTTRSEINEIIEFYKSKNRIDDVVLYSCTSGYPVDFEDVCLREITNLVEILKGTGAKVGFSGHHLGIAVDVAAVTLGAVYVERHFTLDRLGEAQTMQLV